MVQGVGVLDGGAAQLAGRAAGDDPLDRPVIRGRWQRARCGHGELLTRQARLPLERQERRTSKPIIVAHDPNTSDRDAVSFGVAAGRFTGATLIIASVSARTTAHDGPDEDLVADASGALGEVSRELDGGGDLGRVP